MNTTQAQLEALQTNVNHVHGVLDTSVWDKVPGKERLYIKLRSLNGGKNWHGGEGRKCYVDLNTHAFVWAESDWSGAKTREYHAECKTVDLIREAIMQAYKVAT